MRLRTSNFPAATRELLTAGLIARERDGEFLALAPGTEIAEVVKHLVSLGFPIHEIAPEKQTLENFYLSLMKEEGRTLKTKP